MVFAGFSTFGGSIAFVGDLTSIRLLSENISLIAIVKISFASEH